jgi:hypothetical protein
VTVERCAHPHVLRVLDFFSDGGFDSSSAYDTLDPRALAQAAARDGESGATSWAAAPLIAPALAGTASETGGARLDNSWND